MLIIITMIQHRLWSSIVKMLRKFRWVRKFHLFILWEVIVSHSQKKKTFACSVMFRLISVNSRNKEKLLRFGALQKMYFRKLIELLISIFFYQDTWYLILFPIPIINNNHHCLSGTRIIIYGMNYGYRIMLSLINYNISSDYPNDTITNTVFELKSFWFNK